MTRNKKPRKAYRPRWATAHTLAIALHKAAKPMAWEREEVLAALRKSHKALREGVATELDWSILAGALATSMTIEQQGVVRGLQEHFVSAEAALQAVFDRAKSTDTWKPTALWFNELDAINEFVRLHAFQVEQLSRAEWLQAVNTTTAKVRSQGFGATVVRDLERMAA